MLGPALLDLPTLDGAEGRGGALIAGWWTSTTSGTGTVVPDGAVDLVVSPDRTPLVAGPDVEPRPVALPPGVTVVGLRLRPGVASVLLGDGVDRAVGRGVPADQIWARSAVEHLLDELGRVSDGEPAGLAAALARAVERRVPTDWAPDPIVVDAVAAITAGTEPEPMGLGPRQFRRRFTSAMGYGPALFRRIVRLDRFARLSDSAPDLALADLAAGSGYYDQAHLTRDCRQLLGVSPRQFRHR